MDSREDLAVFNRRLASAYTAIEAAKTSAEAAGDAVEDAMHEIGRIGAESASIFTESLADTRSAALMLASAIAALPPLEDESDG